MKSRRSVIRAILFMLRLQKSMAISRESRRNITPSGQQPSTSSASTGYNHHRRRHFLNRAESTRHRRRSSTRQSSQHRNSAPGGSFPPRSPSTAPFPRPANTPDTPLHYGLFGAFTTMSQPYSLDLSDCRGAPLLSVCAGAAHTLASTALLCRQQSLDEHASRFFSDLQRQSSVESTKPGTQKKKVGEDEGVKLHKKIKTNMISLISSLIAIEQDDSQALQAALSKKLIHPDAEVQCGLYATLSPPWKLLDVALMLDSKRCAQLLIKSGASENSKPSWDDRLRAVEDAQESLHEKKHLLKQTLTAKEYEKQVKQLQSHSSLLLKMEGLLKTPSTVKLECARIEVTSSTSVSIQTVVPPSPSAIILKYKVEWSENKSFCPVLGSRVVATSQSHLSVKNITEGRFLHFRVFVGTIYDYGDPTPCTPPIVEMSSWEEIDGMRESQAEQLATITALSDTVEKHRQSLVWQRVFPNNDYGLKKRKNGLRELFTASSKFAKNMQGGCYLTALIYSEGRILCTVDDCLPCFTVDESVSTLNKEDLQWLLKLSLGWDQLNSLTEANPNAYANNIALSFRAKVISAASDLMNALGMKDIGRLAQPVYHDNVVFLVTVRFINDIDTVQALTTHWMTFEKLLRKRMSCSALDKLTKETVSLMNFFESSQIPLKRGLYVSYLKLHSSLSSIRVVVPDNMPAVLPYAGVRDNPHVTREEWEWIKTIDENRDVRPTAPQRNFHRQLSKAVNTLLHDLDVDPDLVPGHRMLRTEILQLNEDVSVILVLPKPEDVCSAPTGSTLQSDVFEQRRGCTPLSIVVFEMIHLSTYHPPFIHAYCKLSIFLEHFLMISQFEQRKCLLENDSKVYRAQSETLTEFQRQLDAIWANARWISRIASLARDKTAKCTIPLSRLLSRLTEEHTDFGYQSDQSQERVEGGSPITNFPRPKSLIGATSSGSLGEVDRIISLQRSRSIDKSKSRTANTTPIKEEAVAAATVVIVYAAYECGLAKGTSVRLSIAPTTTSQEIVFLVVEQLAKAAARRSGEDKQAPAADEFCLAVVIGARERRLRDDFALLKLQNPWAKGKIFVRRKDAVCSAVEFGNEAAV